MASAVADIARIRKGNERFNAEAKTWDANPGVIKSGQAASAAILERLQSLDGPLSKKRILEIGCGTGILTLLLAPHVGQIVAVDAAHGMIDVLKEKIDTPEASKNVLPLAIMLEDPEDSNLPPADEARPDGSRAKFDVVTSHQVLHHIPDLRAVLVTMHQCLKPGGCLMLTDFQDCGPESRRFHPAAKLDGVARHGINIRAMSELMADVGFKQILVEPYWSTQKTVEVFDGEFGSSGQAQPGQGEQATFPYVICYGERDLES